MILSVQIKNAWLIGQPRATSLLYNSKDAPSFFFGCWNTGTNPDLAVTSADLDSL